MLLRDIKVRSSMDRGRRGEGSMFGGGKWDGGVGSSTVLRDVRLAVGRECFALRYSTRWREACKLCKFHVTA